MNDREVRTILLVDGSASILFYLSMLLRRLEYRVLTAQNAEEALRKMEDAAPSLVLTEIALPRMTGVDLLRRIKGVKRFSAIPVVMLTAKVDPDLKNTCTGLGCTAFLYKPIEPDTLYQTLQTATETAPRAFIRIAVNLAAVIDDGAGSAQPESCTLTTLSEGGFFLQDAQPRSRNSRVSVQFTLEGRRIAARAIVLYASGPEGADGAGAAGMGMKFEQLGDADRVAIHDYIKRQVTQNLAAPSA